MPGWGRGGQAGGVDLPELLRPSGLRAAGYTDDEVRRMLRGAAFSPVRRGSYVCGPLPDDAAMRHAVAVRAAVADLAPGAVVSHVSAAVLHGLPVWAVPLDRVHVTRRRRNGGRSGSLVHVHSASLEDDEIQHGPDADLTSPARTVVDLARSVPFEQAVAVADAAIHAGLVGRPELDALLDRMVRWPGTPNARRVVAFADGGSASVGESRSRVAIARAGLPRPVLQWVVRSAAGGFVGEVDFGWPWLRTIGEFDGRVKYGRLLRPGQDPGDAVFDEKIREDALRATGLDVVRWTWRDLRDFTTTATRLRTRLDRS